MTEPLPHVPDAQSASTPPASTPPASTPPGSTQPASTQPVGSRAVDDQAAYAEPADDQAAYAEPADAHRRWWPMVGAGAAGLVIGALITLAVESNASSAHSTSASTSASVVAPTTPAASAPSTEKARAAARGVRGVITAETGDRWTVRSVAGQTVTVTINAATVFGTKKMPGTRDQFALNANVVVIGKRTGNTVLARRVAEPTTTGKNARTPEASAPTTVATS